MTNIKVYGAPWWPDCKRTKELMGGQRVAYDWLDINEDAEALRFVEELQDAQARPAGKRRESRA